MPARNPQSAETSAALEEVRAVYRDLAARPAVRSCALRTECCQFRLTGKTPYLTKGEALVAARAVRAAGRKALPERADGTCPLLDPRVSRCMIYAARPLGCRTHYCAAAGGPYSRKAVADLIHRLEALDARMGGDGARSLPVALADALASL